MSALVLLALLASEPSAPLAQTQLVATTAVPAEQDGCLDHAVKELGMSAKRRDNERRWDIKSRFLHAAVAEAGGLEVLLSRGSEETRVTVSARWPGEPKPGDVGREMEMRLRSMASKLAQLCGVVRAQVTCTLTAPGAKPRVCAHPED